MNRIALLCGFFLMFAAAERTGAVEQEPVDFNRDIRPILSDACFQCHGPDEATREADLRLDTAKGAYADRDGGAAIVPKDSAGSEIYRRITSEDPDQRMPPADANRDLTAEEIDIIRRWIQQDGAYQKHWSLISPQRPKIPKVSNTGNAARDVQRPHSAVDILVRAKLEKEGMQPSPVADRETLIRRVSLDLTGLPPTPTQIDAFLAENKPDAYQRLVDRLLNSPRFGERMTLEWLDVARYADTHGYHVDSSRDMWLWRDWVINALNGNMPFDQFTIEQLAGDLLPDATTQQKIATGFNRNHGINFEGGAFAEEYRVEYVVDRVHTTSTVFMGLTMKCARCHDHKFDPISQRDYYKFFGLFNTIPEKGIDGDQGNAVPIVELATDQQLAEREQYREQMNHWHRKLKQREQKANKEFIAWKETRLVRLLAKGPDLRKIPEDDILMIVPDNRTVKQENKLRSYYLEKIDKEYREYHTKREEFRRKTYAVVKLIPTSMVMKEMEKPRDTFVLKRGLYDQHGDQVAPGIPDCFPPLPSGAEANRLGVARWLVDPKHPLTARVTVNRYWQMIFGIGIVKTSENFGSQGERPSHPELLDYLADEFVHSGWNVKAIQRRIVSSATYRQSSHVTPGRLARDPENRLLARGPRFRLSAEIIRDSAMAISGLLVEKIGGKSVRPYQPDGLWDEVAFGIKTYGAQVYHQDHGAALYRRGMYTFWKRSCPPPSLATFDAPEREVCTMRRERTNTPLQALVLLNDPTFLETSRKFAERIMAEGGFATAERITWAFRTATSRPPSAVEHAVLFEAYRARLSRYRENNAAALDLMGIGESDRNALLDVSQLAAWTDVARVIMNLDETINKG